MDRALPEIRRAGGDVVAVFRSQPSQALDFCSQQGVAMSCLADPSGDAYRGLGLGETAPRRGFVPAARSVLLRLTSQETATFILGADGTVMLAHYDGAAEDLPIERVLETIRRGSR